MGHQKRCSNITGISCTDDHEEDDEEDRNYRKFTTLSDSSVPYSVKIKIIILRSMD